MTGFFKDVFEAAQQRIRIPFIGSVIFAFIAVIWQALFYLFFAEVPVAERLGRFNDETSAASLYWWPFGIGAAMALVLPFVRVGFAWVARLANRQLHHLQDQEANLRDIRKLEFARDKITIETDLAVQRALGQSRVLEIEERRTIDAAKRHAEVQNEFAPEIAKRLQKQIDELRERSTVTDVKQGRIGDVSEADVSEELLQIVDGLSDHSKTVLVKAANGSSFFIGEKDGGGELFFGNDVIRETALKPEAWTHYLSAVKALTELELIQKADGGGVRGNYRLLEKGQDVVKILGL